MSIPVALWGFFGMNPKGIPIGKGTSSKVGHAGPKTVFCDGLVTTFAF
jgi:hypothetical protein